MNKVLPLVAVMSLLSFAGCGGGDSDEMGLLTGTYLLQGGNITYDNGNVATLVNGYVYANGSIISTYTGTMVIQNNGHALQTINVLGQNLTIDGNLRVVNGMILEISSLGQTFNASYAYDGVSLTISSRVPGANYVETDIWQKISATAMQSVGVMTTDSEQDSNSGAGFGVVSGRALAR